MALPDFTTQDPATYKAAIDATAAAHDAAIDDINSNLTIVGGRLDVCEYTRTVHTYTDSPDAQAMVFGDSGTKIFLLDYTDNTVKQYTLSTPYDLTTMTYSSKVLTFTAQMTGGIALNFNPDGTILYIADYLTDVIFQYTLATAWDISTATYASKSISANSVENILFTFLLSSDGAYLYVMGEQNDTIYRSTLSVPWDISTGGAFSVNSALGLEINKCRSMVMAPNGWRVFMLNTDTKFIKSFHTVQNGEPQTTISFLDAEYNYDLFTSADGFVPIDLMFNDTGTRMYVLDANDKILEFKTGIFMP